MSLSEKTRLTMELLALHGWEELVTTLSKHHSTSTATVPAKLQWSQHMKWVTTLACLTILTISMEAITVYATDKES